jgi:spermidine synthase / saccharopine dehydrogenase (NADP+, L-glutamate-forming)
MALLVGLPCGIATQLVLEGKLGTVGVQAPYNEKECKLLRDILEKEGVGMVERVL